MELERPGTDLVRWRDELYRWLDWTAGRLRGAGGFPFAPSVDLYQTDDAVILEAELPGADPERLEVLVGEDVVTLRGALREETERREAGYVYRERRQGAFHRQLPLPAGVDIEACHAEYRDGILRLTMPKTDEARRRARRVPIDVRQ